MKTTLSGAIINSWGCIYLGLQMDWISISEVVNLAEKGDLSCSEDMLVKMYLEGKESKIDFMNLVKEFTKQNEGVEPDSDPETRDVLNTSFGKTYLDFWKMEFLIPIIRSRDSLPVKFERVAEIYVRLNYAEDMRSLIYFNVIPNQPQGEKALYGKIIEYVLETYDELVRNRIIIANNKIAFKDWLLSASE